MGRPMMRAGVFALVASSTGLLQPTPGPLLRHAAPARPALPRGLHLVPVASRRCRLLLSTAGENEGESGEEKSEKEGEEQTVESGASVGMSGLTGSRKK